MQNEIRRFVEGMRQDLRELGVREGDTLLVHSSLRSLGKVPGGAESVVQALIAALGEEGTLLMPGFSYQTVTQQNPVFEQKNTPVCVSYLPEYFRTRVGTMRSLNPTHSVLGTGKNAAVMLCDHQKDETPCGEHSPLRKLRDVGGKILFLGCGLEPNSSMHAVEELVRPDYLFAEKVTYRMISTEGGEFSLGNFRHNFEGWSQEYQRLAQLLSPQDLHHGRVRESEAYLMNTQPLWEVALRRLRQDPLAFVARKG